MKGQAAMEYLMTYGWAILIVIAVVAALYAMGVFRIVGAPVPCSPCFSYFTYVDYSEGTLKIRNGPRQINVTTVSNGTLSGGTPQVFLPGSDLTITGLTEDTTYTDFNITYVDLDSGLQHTDRATIRA